MHIVHQVFKLSLYCGSCFVGLTETVSAKLTPSPYDAIYHLQYQCMRLVAAHEVQVSFPKPPADCNTQTNFNLSLCHCSIAQQKCISSYISTHYLEASTKLECIRKKVQPLSGPPCATAPFSGSVRPRKTMWLRLEFLCKQVKNRAEKERRYLLQISFSAFGRLAR